MRHILGPKEIAIALTVILLGVLAWFSTKVLDYEEIFSKLLGEDTETVVTSPPSEPEVSVEVDATVEETPPTEDLTVLPEPEPEPEPEPYSFRLLGVGDNLIHDGIFLQAAGRAGNRYDFTYLYQELGDFIAEADIASINQETMLSWSYGPSGYPRFNTPIEMVDTLESLGFDVVNLANNHMFDMGDTGLWETIAVLEERDFTVVGAYHSIDDYWDIPVLTVEDTRLAFVGTSQSTNGLYLSSASEMYASISSSDEQVEEFLAQIARAEEVSDLVVANVHWGTEYSTVPNEFQTNFAQRMVEAGADVILGHHPHVLQPVEYLYASDGRKAVVAYSLGNFVSAQDSGIRMLGGMLDVSFTVDGEEISLDSATLHPTITHYDSYFTNIRVYPYDKYTAQLANSHGVRSYSTFSYDYIYQTVTSIVAGEFLPEAFHQLYVS